MKIEIAPQEGNQKLWIADLLTVRYHQTRLVLAHKLRSEMSALPVMNEDLIALTILANAIEGKKSLSDTIRLISNAYHVVYTWVMNAAAHDLQRLQKDFEAGGVPVLALAAQTGLTDFIDSGVITGPDVSQIMMMAITERGFDRSQEQAVSAMMRLANMEIPIDAPDLITTDTDMAIEQMMTMAITIRLYEMMIAILDNPGKPVGAPTLPKPEAGVQMRAASARRVAAKLAYIECAAINSLRQHVTRFVELPWVLQKASGRIADSIRRATLEYARREIDVPPPPPWSEMMSNELFDRRVTGSWPSNPPDPTWSLSVMYTYPIDPLVDDYTTKVELTSEYVSRLAVVLWEMVERATTSASNYILVAAEEKVVPNLSPIDLSDSMFHGHMATVGRTSDKLPLISGKIPSALWHEDTNNWRLLSSGMDPWRFYTYADAIHRIAMDARVKDVPVVITGAGNAMDLNSLPTIMPHFEIFDAPSAPMPKDLNMLALLWGLAVRDVEHYIENLHGGPSSIGLRLLAEALRFVGVVAVRKKESSAKSVGIVVYPFERTWYHTQAWKKFTDLTNPIVLCQRHVNDNGTSMEAEFVLYPFTHIPTSARPDGIIGSLELVPWDRQVANRPIVRYNVPEDRVAKSVPISGWHTMEQSVADIVLIRTMPDGDVFKPVMVDSAKTDSPQRARCYNAAIRISEPTQALTVGNAITNPPRYESMGNE
jgi:hypothetical protein